MSFASGVASLQSVHVKGNDTAEREASGGNGRRRLLAVVVALAVSNLGTLGALGYFVAKDVKSGGADGSSGAGEQHWSVAPSSTTFAPNVSTSHLKRYATSHSGTAMDGTVKASFATLVMPTTETAGAGRRLSADVAAARSAHTHELHVELLRRSDIGHFVTAFGTVSAGAVRLRIRDAATEAESVIIPMEYDVRHLAYAHHNVLRSNFTGINPSFAFFAHKRHRDAKPVHSFVTLHDDHRVLPTFHSGEGEREWREHVMPFYHQYWRSWIHSKVAPYPLKASIREHFTRAAQAVGRHLPTRKEARQLNFWHTERSDVSQFGVESAAEQGGESVLEGTALEGGGALVGAAAGAIMDRHEWGESASPRPRNAPRARTPPRPLPSPRPPPRLPLLYPLDSPHPFVAVHAAEHPGREAVKTAADLGAEFAGGAGGDAAGGIAGAAIGAAVGGPVGAVVGEEVGSVIGERVGQFAGSEMVEHAAEIHHVTHAVSGFVHHHWGR